MPEPLVLIPDMMCDARVFGPQIEQLSQDRVIVVAPPIHGETVRDMATQILEQTPPHFALTGAGLGGSVAMQMMRQAPERISRLALIATTALPDTPAQASWREPQIVRASAGRIDEALADAIPAENLAPGPGRGAVMGVVRQMAHCLGGDVFVRQSRALQRRPDAQRALQKVRVPVMVLGGAHDQLCPVKRQENMAALIAGAELVILPDAGHYPTLEVPEQVNIGMQAWLDIPLQLGRAAAV